MDEGRQPLSRKIPIPSSKINPYRIIIVLRMVVLGLFFHYRILHPVNDAFALWLISVICEIWFAVSWILDQFPKWHPIERETYLDRLSLRYLHVPCSFLPFHVRCFMVWSNLYRIVNHKCWSGMRRKGSRLSWPRWMYLYLLLTPWRSLHSSLQTRFCLFLRWTTQWTRCRAMSQMMVPPCLLLKPFLRRQSLHESGSHSAKNTASSLVLQNGISLRRSIISETKYILPLSGNVVPWRSVPCETRCWITYLKFQYPVELIDFYVNVTERLRRV